MSRSGSEGPNDLGLGAASLGPLPSRSNRPPGVWGSIDVEGDQVVVGLRGWRGAFAMKRRIVVPLDAVVDVRHDPGARARIRTKLIQRPHRTTRVGVFRIGTLHGRDGWSFWSIGLGRNAVAIEAVGTFYQFVVVEVADPAATVAAIEQARRDLPGGGGADGSHDPESR